MKTIFLVSLGLFFGFFDVYLFMSFVMFSLLFLFLEMGGTWFGGVFFSDGVSFFLFYLSLSLLVFCFFSSFLDHWFSNFSFSFFFILFFIFFLLYLTFSVLSFFVFYICFELIFMFMFFFVLFWGYSPERLEASFYMVFYTIVVSFPFLVFITSFGWNFCDSKFLCFYSFSYYWWFFLLFVFLVKLPVYGVHLWLPKAHVEAPVSGSMVLAGVLLKLGSYGFIRFCYFLNPSLFYGMGYVFSFGVIGGLMSCLICLRQSDLKSFVAYSSICHMGMGLAGIFCYSSYGFSGGVYMMIAHGFCSSSLFYILYIVYERFHSRSLFVVKGALFSVPMMVLSWFVFSAINMGVPPSFSFFSEILIVSGSLGLNWNFSLLFFSFLFLCGVYGIYIFVVSCHGSFLLSGVSYCVSSREYLNLYGHFFPLVFLPFVLNFFF